MGDSQTNWHRQKNHLGGYYASTTSLLTSQDIQKPLLNCGGVKSKRNLNNEDFHVLSLGSINMFCFTMILRLQGMKLWQGYICKFQRVILKIIIICYSQLFKNMVEFLMIYDSIIVVIKNQRILKMNFKLSIFLVVLLDNVLSEGSIYELFNYWYYIYPRTLCHSFFQ